MNSKDSHLVKNKAQAKKLFEQVFASLEPSKTKAEGGTRNITDFSPHENLMIQLPPFNSNLSALNVVSLISPQLELLQTDNQCPALISEMIDICNKLTEQDKQNAASLLLNLGSKIGIYNFWQATKESQVYSRNQRKSLTAERSLNKQIIKVIARSTWEKNKAANYLSIRDAILNAITNEELEKACIEQGLVYSRGKKAEYGTREDSITKIVKEEGKACNGQLNLERF